MSDLLRDVTARLSAAGIDSARTEARILIGEAKRISLSPNGGEGRGEGATGHRISGPPHPNPLPQGGRGNVEFILESLVQRRIAHEPIAYITGHKEFWSLDFEVGPGVLIPRPETELLVEEALKAFPGKDAPLNILDLGTGSGAIPIAFLSERPNARGLGIEQSQDAMIWARKNIANHKLESRLRLQGDDWLMMGEGEFDVIFSNPPYIESGVIPTLDPDVKDYEPRTALDGGRDGLDAYRAIAPIIAARLASRGRAFLEIGQGQEQKVPSILTASGLETLQVAADLAGIPRCVIAAPA